MRLPRMSGNAWVCAILGVILLAAGVEQWVHRASATDEPPPRVMLAPGTPAPGFTLADPQGKQYTLAQFRGKPTVVAFYCGCSACERIAKPLAAWQKQTRAQAIGLVTFPPEVFAEFRQKTGTAYPLVRDHAKEVAAAWDSLICPRLWVVDGSGRVMATTPREPTTVSVEETMGMVKDMFARSASTLGTEAQ